MTNLWSRLRKARPFQVLLVYLGASWLVLEVTDVFIDQFGLPNWFFQAAILLLLIGLVVLATTAWVQARPVATPEDQPSPWEVDLVDLRDSVSHGRIPHLTWARALLGGVVAFVLLFGVAAGYVLVGDRVVAVPGPEAEGERLESIAVLPFTVRGESSDLEYLEEGLADLLSISLSDLPGIRPVDPYALSKFVEHSCDAPSDPACGSVAAARFGAGRFLLGTIVPAGDQNFQLTAVIYEADKTELSRVIVRSDGDEPLSAIEEMGRRIAVDLLGSETAAVEASGTPAVAARTTTSLTALKAYLRGEALFRSARYGGAIAALREAVAEDSAFALAWFRLALAANIGVHVQLADSAADKTMELIDRLPTRYRGLVRGFNYFHSGKADLAEREFKNLLTVYPNDPEAWYLLGMTQNYYAYQRGRRIKSYPAFKRAVELDPDLAPALWELRVAALYAGRIEEFDSLTKLYIEKFPDAEGHTSGRVAMADSRLAGLLLAEEDSTRERWFAELESATDDEISMVAGVLFQTSWPDRIALTERAARILLDPGRSASGRVEGHSILGELAMREGRWRDAFRHADAIARIDPVEAIQRRSHWAATALFHPFPESELEEIRANVAALIEGSPRRRTLRLPWGDDVPPAAIVAGSLKRLSALSARLGEFDKARDYAARFANQPIPPPTDKLQNENRTVLRAYIRYWQGDYEAARAALDSVRREVHWAFSAVGHVYWSMLLRAEVHYQLGDWDEARRWFRLWPTPEGNSLRDLGPALYRLGQIHQAMGEPRQARQRYRQFIDLWENADPELHPLVADARERLAALGEPGV